MSRSRMVMWMVGVGVSTALAVAGVAASQGASPVEQRQATMKHVGLQMKQASAFTSPATAFDAAKVGALMDGVAADATKLKVLYPAGSDTDPKTAADPKIWQNKARLSTNG